MKTNKIDVIITLTEAGLKLIQKTDTLKYLFHVNQFESLKIGENKLTVNHFTFNKMMNLLNTNNPLSNVQHIKCEKNVNN